MLNTSHWQEQYERWGIRTNNYRKLKKDAYQRQKQEVVYDRKQRELNRLTILSPVGRGHHLIQQMARISTHVQAG